MIFTSHCFPPCSFHRRLASAVPRICQTHLFQGLYPDGCPAWGAFPLDLFMAHFSTSSSFFSNVTLLNKHALADYPNHLPLCSTIPFTLCLLYKLWQSMYLFVVCLPTLDCKRHQSRDLFCLPLCSQCLEWFLENEADAWKTLIEWTKEFLNLGTLMFRFVFVFCNITWFFCGIWECICHLALAIIYVCEMFHKCEQNITGYLWRFYRKLVSKKWPWSS